MTVDRERIGLHMRRAHGYDAATVACNWPSQLDSEHRRIHAAGPHGHGVEDLSNETVVEVEAVA